MTRPLFRALIKNGRSFNATNLSLKTYKAPDSSLAFSVVVPKSVSRKASHRNTLKRRGYHAIKEIIPEITSPHHSVFFLKRGSETLLFQELKRDISSLLRKAKQIR
jgi:ribonuclease P protein component